MKNDNNIAAILMIMLYLVIIVKHKKIYLNITNDNKYICLKKFRFFIFVGSFLMMTSSLLLIYVNINNVHDKIINEIGFDSLILSAITMAYGMNYITSEKRFPNGNINIITSIRRSIKWIIIITILSIVGGLINAFW